MKKLVIAGTGSGVGKTSITLGIIRHLKNQGYKIISFKCGPDYLDPSWHRLASGNECYNLDGWMTDRKYVTELFSQKSAGYDFAIIEGVMGMFDGASPTTIEGSTAQIANWLNAPVALICNSHGVARSLAATVKGFNNFENDISVDAVIANFCGSRGHASILEDSLSAANLAPLAGWVKRESLPSMPSRHLGLHTAAQVDNAESLINQISKTIAETIDFEKLFRKSKDCIPTSIQEVKTNGPTIGLAKDEAFQFYYPDNLESLKGAGFQVIEFSPIKDSLIPECDLLYFGGGYPEIYAEQLSKNESMIDSIVDFSGKIYAECGGLMYLSRAVKDLNGKKFPMCNILPFETEMLPKRKMLGYMTTTLNSDCFFGKAGTLIKGHEFHYSQIVQEQNNSWEKAYSVKGRRKTSKDRLEGWWNGRILASYVHQHFASNSKLIKNLFDYLSK